MSLYESGDSTGDVSLKDLFDGKSDIDGDSNLSIDRLAFLVCRGGWPQAVGMRDEIALDQAQDYYDAVVHSDINRTDNVQKNPEKVRRLMRSYARNQGGQVPNTYLFRILRQMTRHLSVKKLLPPTSMCFVRSSL